MHFGDILYILYKNVYIFYIMTITPNDQTIHFQQNYIDSKKSNHEVSTQFNTMEYHANDLKKHLYIMYALVFWW